MKKTLFTLIIISISLFTYGQEVVDSSSHRPVTIIKTNPVALFLGAVNGNVEIVQSEKNSILISAAYTYSSFGIEVSALGVGAGYRFYSTKMGAAPEGLWVMPQIGLATGSYEFWNEKVKFNTFQIGAQGGYQWVWDNGLALDLGLGFNYTKLGGDLNGNPFEFGVSNVGPAVTVGLGYAF